LITQLWKPVKKIIGRIYSACHTLASKVRKPIAKKASKRPPKRAKKGQTPMSALVIEIARQARLRLNMDDAEIAAALVPLVGQTYSRGSINGWANGHSRPPADAILGLVKLTEGLERKVSLDELLFGKTILARQDRMEEGLRELRRLIEK
jgi:transcriptional regulator with XRE-family HTH domain